jgi:hypothetical protein
MLLELSLYSFAVLLFLFGSALLLDGAAALLRRRRRPTEARPGPSPAFHLALKQYPRETVV